MVRFPKSLLGLMIALSLTVAGCATTNQSRAPEAPSKPDQAAVDRDAAGSPSTTTSADRSTPQPTKTPAPVAAQPADAPKASERQIPVSIYVMDDACNDLVKKTVEVNAKTPIEAAIGQVIAARNYEAFDLTGYRVNVDNQTATVDLRLAPDSQRQFVSLSSCEQRTLFGGIQETLLKSEQWEIDTVKFTSRGEDILL